jgi:cystathionine beta-lyase/cystathionine gamma-synthase
MKFGTKAIHAGIEPDPATGAVMTPIYQTSTYAQSSPGVHKGYEYARTGNPTRTVLEDNLAALENGKFGICFSSGLAAMDAVIRLLQPGDEVLACDDLYGGSYRLLTKVHGGFGIKSRFVGMNNLSAFESAIRPETKLIWIETPTNPMLNIVDILAICTISKKKGILTCVDNTFASPYLQNPLDLGADIVLHSLRFIQNAVGAVPGPQDCFLILRGIKTLHIRVERACQNAAKIADFLRSHSKIKQVFYPGFIDHPGHDIAASQMRHFGGMVSFNLFTDTLDYAEKLLSNTKLFTLAESLGGVESLIGHPATMTHASIPREERLKVGLTDSLIRLSVGIEDVSDLIDDLNVAIDHLP